MMFPEEVKEYDPVQMGERMLKIRLQKKIKSIDMAMQIDISKNHYSNIEYGTTVCSSKVLHKIAQNLEVSADYLLFGNEEDECIKSIYSLLRGKSPKDIKKMLQVIRIMPS